MAEFTIIDGVKRITSELTLPASREFRDAWVLNGDVVTVDPAKVSQHQSDELDRLADDVMVVRGPLRALALVMLKEINTLRAEHSLPDYTAGQMRAAVRDKMNG